MFSAAEKEIEQYCFPDPAEADANGLVAWGGDLEPDRILTAYRSGIFPWYSKDQPILWWSPDPRLVLRPQKLKLSKSFRKTLRRRNYRVVFDGDFKNIMNSCAGIKRRNGEETWINRDMVAAYTLLHKAGYAHSVEVYTDNRIAGGLYGLAIGKIFFGESMFSKIPDASKIALKALSDVLSERSYDFIDCQVVSGHLLRMGAEKMERSSFIRELKSSVRKVGDIGSWSQIEWEYEDGR